MSDTATAEPTKEETKKEFSVSADVQKILDSVSGFSDTDKNALVIKVVEQMTVLGLSDLVSLLEDTFGVSAAAPAMAMAMAGPAGDAEPEEKSSFNVVLKEIGDKKIQVIKAVRACVANLSLKEAKALVDGAPGTIKEGAAPDEAEKIKAALEEAGAVVTLE